MSLLLVCSRTFFHEFHFFRVFGIVVVFQMLQHCSSLILTTKCRNNRKNNKIKRKRSSVRSLSFGFSRFTHAMASIFFSCAVSSVSFAICFSFFCFFFFFILLLLPCMCSVSFLHFCWLFRFRWAVWIFFPFLLFIFSILSVFGFFSVRSNWSRHLLW